MPANFVDHALEAWVLLTAQGVWAEHGPTASLVVLLSPLIGVTIERADDFRTGYSAARHALAVGEARGYEPATSVARHLNAVLAQHWFEPIERSHHEAQRAREGLLRGGELQAACFTHFTSVVSLLESAATIDVCADATSAALAMAAQTGNTYIADSFVVFRQFCLAVQGRTSAPGSFDCRKREVAAFDESEFLDHAADNPSSRVEFHIYRAICAALFNDGSALIDHALAARSNLAVIEGFYPRALGALAVGLAAAQRLRIEVAEPERVHLLADLDGCRRWLRARAVDAPDNFAHLASLLDAERARADGAVLEAQQAYDAARRQVARTRRPWHQALIAERAARFHQELGLVQAGDDLLEEAASIYAAWGATGKVDQLKEDNPTLRMTDPRSATSTRTSSYRGSSTDQLDLMAVLRTSQALSSERHFDHLLARVGELIGAMAGATTVLLAVREDEGPWTIWDASGSSGGVAVAEAGSLLPVSAFDYAIRSAEPLLVVDAVQDDRFATDPYLVGKSYCSLMVLPIRSRSALRTVLVLENSSRRGAFTASRLDALQLVAGQLSVSVDNAVVYATLENRVNERTAELAQANQALEALSATDALTGLPNRRHFDATLDAGWHVAVTTGTALAVAMIDVDCFKSYNDRYGHVAGDDCLRQVATSLRRSLRGGSDVVCRYGGEEFAIVMPGVTLADLELAAERVRAGVAGLDLPHADAPDGIVSVSIGIAVYDPAAAEPDRPASGSGLVSAADAGLYLAKAGGRNRVCSLPSVRS